MINTVKDLAITAFGLVAALAWNAAIQKLFEVIFPNKTNSLIAMFLYALFVTAIVVFVTYYLIRIADTINSAAEIEEDDKKDNNKK
ncbi:hypothetical protein COX95_04900 [bacterium CG_4_10_14_0_2_um_filter_33_32]|nr:MAG: hypothetical protein COU50_04445 [bacterium CG10_big_fil_rev_8_21_14_0_10_33_18]PIU77115.1 MAG: hypothetical protein COS74_00525 [bacterium CG06_land_8_20_14_3_00_33_50]PIW81174.1 MAG: hypothetical protein COZ97_03170 [bacterium CG_4_8_14_3_um_filter_33_28]PIY85418.1 MAG: hypothetical protein COY76_02270 [bacterium CG_4_10_14_0_8_um_filter_33_57]PIZ85210.1 MAG: hypothetical protein COX95_04900 [bacterium CG_4_10_14_0_2_um_filter_33_32]PJA71814.1 MAG: hypothetical protein CO152_04700 [b